MNHNSCCHSRVLLVEDNKISQAIMAQMLENLGFEVKCADNGKLGIDTAKRWRPDLILMDIYMPVVDGLEATRTLRRDPATQAIPIFILSAYTDAKTRLACQLAGANKFFNKPLDIHRFKLALQEMLTT